MNRLATAVSKFSELQDYTMWHPQKLETKSNKLDLSSSEQDNIEVHELWADGIMLSNAIELSNWHQDPIQFIVCGHCGIIHCSSGNWLSPRRAGEYVLFIPEFAKMSNGSWEMAEYQPPYYFNKFGSICFNTSEYVRLRDLVPRLPERSLLQNLTSKEAARLLQWEAPFKCLGEFPYPLIFQKQFFLGSNQESDDRAILELERILCETIESESPVTLKEISENEELIQFFLEDLEFKDWQPLCRTSDGIKLLLSTELVVSKIYTYGE